MQTASQTSHNVVIRKRDGLRLLVLDVVEMFDGRPGYAVCKETAANPKMGRFKVAQDDVEPDFK